MSAPPSIRGAYVSRAFLAVSVILASACDTDVMTPSPAQSVATAAISDTEVAAATEGTTFPLQMVVDDPLGDNSGPIDATRMILRFDATTGAYEIEITAAPDAPFMGDFRINLNLFNVSAASFFQDALNDYSLTTPVTRIVLAGTSGALSAWSPGDQVYTNSLAGTPNPPGSTLFRSSVSSVPFGFLTNEDYIAFADPARPAIIEPATPEVAVELLVGAVDDLLSAGELSSDQAAGLLDKLNAVLLKISAGRTTPAIMQLHAFINQVNALVHAGLDAGAGQALIDAAAAVILMLT